MDVFRLAALQAGSVARRLQNQVPKEFKEGERTPESAALTAVDLAVQDLILYALRYFFPNAAVDAEEETDTVSLFLPASAGVPLIVVDPIDGTLNYANGSLDYAVMGGLLEHGLYQAVLIYLPANKEMYWASAGGCWQHRGAAAPRRVRVGHLPARAMVTPNVPKGWQSRLAEMGLEVCVSRCSAIDSSAPVSGRASVSVSMGRPDRRRSLGYLLVREAGGAVFLGEQEWVGEDPSDLPDFDGPTVVSATRERAEQVLRHLRSA